MSSRSLPMVPASSFNESANYTLEGLWAAVHRGACPAEVRSLLAVLLEPWGSIPVPATPAWPSDIGGDHSPFEFSVVVTGGVPEIRIVVEAQGNDGTFHATRDACLRLNDVLAARGADLGRLAQIQDLFLPPVRDARFAIWHSIILAPGRMRAKAYLNPQIAGTAGASGLAMSAFDRLGMSAAWSTVASALPTRPLRGSEIRYFALDLDPSTESRIKVYLYLEEATAHDLERLAMLRPAYVPGEVTDFCRAMTRANGSHLSPSPSVYLAFTGNDPVPSDVTVQIPIARYAPDDRIARDRVRAYLRSRRLDPIHYDRALAAVAKRPLDAGSGLHTYVSVRTGSSPARVTAYFAAELYGAQPPIRGDGGFRSSGHGQVHVLGGQSRAHHQGLT
jgi:DMATS type aromatic prenyltransferase